MTPTDHTHLGQLVTYAANTDAVTIVWTALSFREEHRQAIVFLNDLGGERARFFGVEIGAVRIGDSAPAPLSKVVAQPNDFHAQESTTAQVTSQGDASGRGALYQTFWQNFLERVHAEHPDWTRATKGPAQNWLTLPSRFKGGNVRIERELEEFEILHEPIEVFGVLTRALDVSCRISGDARGSTPFERLPGQFSSEGGLDSSTMVCMNSVST